MPNEQEQLEDLLRRAADGDEEAWRQILELYAPRVHGLLRAQCGNSDLAEEITQSTFCTIVTKLRHYTEQGRFESWLFRIAMNRLRDEMRRRTRHAVNVEEGSLIGLAGPAPSDAGPDDPDAPELQRLRAAMQRLPDADRTIIQLRHHGELSFRQIAEVLDQPIGTVLARQHRALKKLRDLMGADEPEGGDDG